MAQEGVHVNAFYLTTCTESYAIAFDELAGGTVQDYFSHICEVISKLTSIYATFHDDDSMKCSKP